MQRRAAQQHPGGEDDHHRETERDHGARKRPEAALQGSGRRLGRRGKLGDVAHLGLIAGRGHEGARAPARDTGARVEHREALGQRRADENRFRRLLHRVRLACERGLVDGELFSSDDAGIGGYSVSLANDDQISSHELGGRDRSLAAATDNGRRNLDRLAQREERPLGPGFLDEAEDGVEHDDRRDDPCLEALPDDRRDRCRGQQQTRERIRELAERDPGVPWAVRRGVASSGRTCRADGQPRHPTGRAARRFPAQARHRLPLRRKTRP